MNVMPETSRAH